MNSLLSAACFAQPALNGFIWALLRCVLLLLPPLVYLPRSMATQTPSLSGDAVQAGYPAKAKHASGLVDGILTEVTAISFTDKLLITISQDGKLAQWVRCLLRISSFILTWPIRYKYQWHQLIQLVARITCHRALMMISCHWLG